LAAGLLVSCSAVPAWSQPAGTPVVETARDALPDLLALGRGTLRDGLPVSSLFAVRLDRLAEVEQRFTALRSELAAIEGQLAQKRARTPESADPPEPLTEAVEEPDSEAAPVPILADATPEVEGAALEARRAVAEARLVYLGALVERLRAMPEAARRILPGVAEPRTALRERAAATTALADALAELAGRLDDLSLRLASGTLVGFRAEAREQAERLRSAAEVVGVRSERLHAVADGELRLAGSLEAEARALRREFFVTLLAPDREARMDGLFLSHIAEQRRLQRSMDVDLAGVDRIALEELRVVVSDTLSRPEQIGTVALASRMAETLGEAIARVDAAIDASRNAQDGWRLAYENEVVTILSAQISASVRREAYAFSNSMLRDVRSEAVLAWERTRESWQGWRLGAESGLGWLLRLFGLAAVVGVWWAALRYTGSTVTRALRAAARAASGRFGVRIGTLVRWSGLLQSMLPALLVYPALRAWIAILGESGSTAELVSAVGMPFFWYAMGRQLLLGLTQRITWGRPALIEVSSAKLPALRRTYARLGLIVAAAAALDGIARIVIGEGVIVLLVDGLALSWVVVWAAWEALEWRPELAEAWQAMLPETGARLERSLAEWMLQSRLGFLLSPYVVARGLVIWMAGVVVEISHRTDLAELIAARRLRRAAAKNEDVNPPVEAVPEAYLREFPLRPILGEDDALLLPRHATVSEIVSQIEHWRDAKSEGSIALIGEKGSGKTTLAALVARQVDDPVVVEHTLRGKPADEEALFRELLPSLPVNGATDLREWIDGLCAGPERVVLLDEAHNVFLRTVGGYRAYDALVDLVNATSSRIFWVLLFNNFTWRFLNESRSRQHFFRKLITVPSWSADELRDLIRRRNKQTGFEVEFDEMLLAGERGEAGLELVEGADGYFRLLRETSGGNPRIATRLWLSSLSVVSDKKLRVSAFREPSSSALDGMSDELLFALAAISQHENLSTDELRRVLNVSEGLARFAVQFLSEAGLIVTKDGSADRFTLAANFYRQTLRALRQKHLLFE
jgi:hypothetical protein